MSTYIRGPVCGIANCPSHLWRIIDGRRTCQYGHVMEGDVEFNNDDDEASNAGVITRRLNLTTNATGNFQSSFSASQSQNLQRSQRSKKIYGYEANLLFLKAFQFILKKQTTWLIRKMKFSNEFDRVVKIIWASYLKSINEDELQAASISGGGIVDDDSNEDAEGQRLSGHFKLNMVSTIAILYMASVHMGLPVYTCDFVKWASSAKLPYFNSNDTLPESWREKLPNYYLGLLDGGKVPHDGQIFQKVARIGHKISFKENFNSRIMHEGIILKLVMVSTLPPDFYFFTANLIKSIDTNGFELFEDDSSKFKKYYLCAELRIAAYFVLAIKWILICDEENYSTNWILALLTRPKGVDVSQDTIDRRISRLSSSVEKTDVFDWSKDETSDYLNWIEKSFLPIQNSEAKMNIDHRIAKRKLYKIFSTESDAYHTGSSNNLHPTFVEELQENYIYFQSEMESHWNDNEDPSQDVETRITAILRLESMLINEIATEYAFSTDQLRATILHVKKHYLTHYRKLV